MEREKKRLYQKSWFLWLWLVLFPPVGLILLWTVHKDKKRKTKIVLSVVFVIWFVILMTATGGGSKEPANTDQPTQSHIYQSAQIKDVINGSRTEKIGEYSIIEVSSEKVTDEALTDWYFNYVEKNDYNWCMILYTDKDNNLGVYAIEGMVQKDVIFEKDEFGDYMLGDSSKGIVYGPTDDRTLEEIKFEE